MRHNFTIDAPNSLIRYSQNGWRMVSYADDPDVNSYQNGTAMVTDMIGQTALFLFNGTGVWVYGAKRPNHGTYGVIFDGAINKYNGTSATNVFQTLLFGKSNLEPAQHSLTLSNQDGWFDIDFIVWEVSIMDGKDQAYIDDSNYSNSTGATLLFQYLPSPSLWYIATNESGAYMSTLSTTQKGQPWTSLLVPSSVDPVAISGKLPPRHRPSACLPTLT